MLKILESQFPLSVIAIFICRVLIWLVFQFFLGLIVNSSCDMEEELRWQSDGDRFQRVLT